MQAQTVQTVQQVQAAVQQAKPYILFVLPTDRPSLLAVQIANTLYDLVDIQYVQNMPIRPAWLDGVPLLVEIHKKTAFRGQNAIEVLKHIHESQPTGFMLKNKSIGYAVTDSFNNPLGENVFSTQPAPIMRSGTSCELLDNLYTAGDDEQRYSDVRKEKTTEDKIQQYMNLREQRLSAIRPTGAPPTVTPKWLQPQDDRKK